MKMILNMMNLRGPEDIPVEQVIRNSDPEDREELWTRDTHL